MQDKVFRVSRRDIAQVQRAEKVRGVRHLPEVERCKVSLLQFYSACKAKAL